MDVQRIAPDVVGRWVCSFHGYERMRKHFHFGPSRVESPLGCGCQAEKLLKNYAKIMIRQFPDAGMEWSAGCVSRQLISHSWSVVSCRGNI